MPPTMPALKETKPLLHLEEYRLKQDPQDYGISDDVWNLERFKRQCKIVVVRYVLTSSTSYNTHRCSYITCSCLMSAFTATSTWTSSST